MGLMDKIKNMFTEEEEIEEEPIKKEVIQVEIPSPMTKKETTKEVRKEVDDEVIEQPKEKPVKVVQETKVTQENIVKPQQKREDKFVFPVYFDDDDFTTIENKNKEERKAREEKRIIEERQKLEEKRVIPKPIKDSYKGKPVEEEKKTFKPTPIISPVYGILNKNYTKEDITTKQKPETSKKVSDVDLIRNKAYGSLEDEMVDSLNYKEEKVHTNKDMEEYHKKMDDVDFDELLDNDNLDNNLDELETKLTKTKTTKTKETQPKYSRALKNKDLDDVKISEDDLFDMIDTMYEEGK